LSAFQVTDHFIPSRVNRSILSEGCAEYLLSLLPFLWSVCGVWIASGFHSAVARSSGSKEGPMVVDNKFRAVERCGAMLFYLVGHVTPIALLHARGWVVN
jgi:hypothetical protein